MIKSGAKGHIWKAVIEGEYVHYECERCKMPERIIKKNNITTCPKYSCVYYLLYKIKHKILKIKINFRKFLFKNLLLISNQEKMLDEVKKYV
jgi:hypothetical protein